MTLKWSVWTHTFNRVATRNPVVCPAKCSIGLFHHYPIIHVRADDFPTNQTQQTIWSRQRAGGVFIYAPPMGEQFKCRYLFIILPIFLLLHSSSSHRRKRLIQLLRRDDSVFSWSSPGYLRRQDEPAFLPNTPAAPPQRGSVWDRTAGQKMREEGQEWGEREWRERSCVTAWPQIQQTEEEQHLPMKQDRGQTHPQLRRQKDLRYERVNFKPGWILHK